jgi:hypothetical protein
MKSNLVTTKDRQAALDCAKLASTPTCKYVVRESYGEYCVVPDNDPGYAGVGVLVAESLK